MAYPQEYEQPYEQPKSPTEVIIGNIIKASVSIFLIALGFFICILVISVLNTQTGVDYTTYQDDFSIANPLMVQIVYTSNPHLENIVVTKYNATNATFGGVPSSDWTFDSTTTELVVTTGLEHTITSLSITADTTYSEPPVLSVFSAIALALIILSIAGIFGLVGWRHYNNQQYR